MYRSFPLILLGLNQTLMVALLPEIAQLLSLSTNESGLALLTIAINCNLISYWLGTVFWGRYLAKIGWSACYRITLIGFILSNVLVWLVLFYSAQPELYLLAASRLLVGLFSSAFVILVHTALAQQNQANMGQLSKSSGTITIGRLLGPSLVLLPISIQYLLLLPILAALLLALCSFFSQHKLHNLSLEKEKIKTSTNSYSISLILTCALLTTTFVNCLQYFLLPLLFNLGYQGEQASELFAAILLYLSIAVIAYQFILIPYLSRHQQQFPTLIITALVVASALLTWAEQSWLLLMLALSIFAFAISALPSWYSQFAFRDSNNIQSNSAKSAAITRAHSSGHLSGVALASLCLYLSIPMQLTIVALVLALIFFIISINKGALQLIAPFAPSTHNKDEHEQHQDVKY